MGRVTITALGAMGFLLLVVAPAAFAAEEFDQYRVESVSGSLSSAQAGAHPDFTTTIVLSHDKEGHPYAKTRDVSVRLPAGIFGNPNAFPTCTRLQLGTEPNHSECPLDSQVGSTDITVTGINNGAFEDEPIYNMPAPGGDTVARFGFYAAIFPVIVNARLDPQTDTIVASVEGASSADELVQTAVTFWGVPAASVHDSERITPLEAYEHNGPPGGRKSTQPKTPFMTNPTSCGEERQITVTATSYQLPSAPSTASGPFPDITGCGALEFNPSTSLAPTTTQGSTGSGIDYELRMPTKGLEFDNLLYGSEAKRAEVVLPKGMTVNPSEAEGLGVCSEEDLSHETYNSAPNAGCPETSKIGSVVAESPVVDRKAEGSLYLAKPYQNPFGSLLALYMVLKIPDRGVLVKLSGEVHPDPQTGQLITTFDDVPQLPVADFKLHFREGARAPLITPRTCGAYQATSTLSPWSSPARPLVRQNSFPIESGPDHGPCPAGATPPFGPGFAAYPINATAGAFSPFFMRLTRRDGDQDLTKFSATLPEGLAGILAGLTQCPDTAIARARGRTGQNGGHEEQADPSCPRSSEIGHVVAGAGVGDVLTYAEGKIYLAGPYNGAPLSVVAIVPAVAGPFDVGTVVTRQALRVNPRTAQVYVDGSSSDPIPHILQGIPLTVRNIRVYVDRKNFIFNPTSCEPMSTAATVWGGGADVFSSADDSPVSLSERFQAADCAALGFKPRLDLTLKGGTKRGAHPALRGAYLPRSGDANLDELVLRLPHSAFLEQAHIRTICTRVQFAAAGGNGAGCPTGAVYGYARAFTPVLSEPLEGPVYLRSSDHNLPDFVAALHGLVDVEAVARIDSVHGGIRATFTGVPDAPLTKVVVSMQGGKKGLIVNSTDLCAAVHRANAKFTGHNGKVEDSEPALKAKCPKSKKHRHRKHKLHRRASGRAGR